MQSIFVIDSSSLVDAWNVWYPPRLFPGFWDALISASASGRVVIPYEVADELHPMPKEYGLGNWIADHRDLCAESDRDVQRVVTRLQRYEGFGGTGAGSRNYADPFVVAHAVVRKTEEIDPIVVTQEELGKRGAPPKIPNVCQMELLKVRKVYVLLDGLQMQFPHSS